MVLLAKYLNCMGRLSVLDEGRSSHAGF